MGKIKKIVVNCDVNAKPIGEAIAKINDDLCVEDPDHEVIIEIVGDKNVDIKKDNARSNIDN